MSLSLFACARQAKAAPSRPTLADVSSSLRKLVEKAGPAIVKIEVRSGGINEKAETTTGLLSRQRSSGSGVFIDGDGYLITNYHVVAGATEVFVVRRLPGKKTAGSSILSWRTERLRATIVGSDPETDLALLKVDAVGLPYLSFADSDNVAQGEIVVAVGSPHGLDNSVSIGVVSATARQLQPEHPVVYIQTDASINPGNSGGPLLDVDGRIVGIATFILSKSGGSQGLNFAIPSNIVRYVARQLRANGRVRRGLIGINAQTITEALAKGLKLPVQEGVVLADVFPGGPADQAGLKVGDVVVSLEGKAMENGRQLAVNLYQREPGSTVKLQVLRGSRELEVKVDVLERPDNAISIASALSPKENLVSEIGVLGLDVDLRMARMPLRERSGVLVVGVSSESRYVGAPLAQGDVIHEVNSRAVLDINDLRTELRRVASGEVVVQIERGGQYHYIVLEISSQ